MDTGHLGCNFSPDQADVAQKPLASRKISEAPSAASCTRHSSPQSPLGWKTPFASDRRPPGPRFQCKGAHRWKSPPHPAYEKPHRPETQSYSRKTSSRPAIHPHACNQPGNNDNKHKNGKQTPLQVFILPKIPGHIHFEVLETFQLEILQNLLIQKTLIGIAKSSDQVWSLKEETKSSPMA